MMLVTKIALAGLVLMGFALAMSRRSIEISTALCFLALGFLVAGFVVWLRLQ